MIRLLPERATERLAALCLIAFRFGFDSVEITAMLTKGDFAFTEAEVIRLIHAARDAEKGVDHGHA